MFHLTENKYYKIPFVVSKNFRRQKGRERVGDMRVRDMRVRGREKEERSTYICIRRQVKRAHPLTILLYIHK